MQGPRGLRREMEDSSSLRAVYDENGFRRHLAVHKAVHNVMTTTWLIVLCNNVPSKMIRFVSFGQSESSFRMHIRALENFMKVRQFAEIAIKVGGDGWDWGTASCYPTERAESRNLTFRRVFCHAKHGISSWWQRDEKIAFPLHLGPSTHCSQCSKDLFQCTTFYFALLEK